MENKKFEQPPKELIDILKEHKIEPVFDDNYSLEKLVYNNQLELTFNLLVDSDKIDKKQLNKDIADVFIKLITKFN